ncbi:cobalamin biosynthesis protein [Immundisolibacter sp.]
MTTALLASVAVLIDALLGEPRRRHPLVGFGRLATWLESRLYGSATAGAAARRGRGGLALAALVVPATAGAALLAALPGVAGAAMSAALLYLALGQRSLREHAAAVAAALHRNDLPAARAQVRRMVSRDCTDLDRPGITGATVESVLENGNDAVFGALLWFALAGAPGTVAYRLVNTLDAMWGLSQRALPGFRPACMARWRGAASSLGYLKTHLVCALACPATEPAGSGWMPPSPTAPTR